MEKQINKNHTESFRSESGAALSWAILLSTIIIGAYAYGGEAYLDQHLSPFYNAMVVMAGAVICVFTIGCGLHLQLLGGKSNRELRKYLTAQNKALIQVISESDDFIRSIEADLGRCSLKLTPRGLDCLALARRIVRALDRRALEISKLLATRDNIDLIDAEEISRRKLLIDENCVDSLIGSESVPPLPPEEWLPSLKRIFEEIEIERKRAA